MNEYDLSDAVTETKL